MVVIALVVLLFVIDACVALSLAVAHASANVVAGWSICAVLWLAIVGYFVVLFRSTGRQRRDREARLTAMRARHRREGAEQLERFRAGGWL